MSTVKANNHQIGQSGTATNNFTLYQPSTPDGTVRLAVGNSGATSADVLTANSSGNVGIGTSSPGERLTVAATANNAGRFTSTATTTALVLDNTNANGWGSNIAIKTGDVAAGYFGTIGSLLGNTTQDLAVYATAGNGFRVYTNGNNLRATLDSSGNLGLGVTPSAWGSARKAFQLNGGSVYATTAGDTVGVSQNAYNDGARWRYVSNGYASSYYQNSGGHQFNIAPSGTVNTAVVAASTSYTVVALGTTSLAEWQASFSGLSSLPTIGQALTSLASPVSPIPNGGLVSQNITFTQAMTLDASGNLGVGTTSPTYKLDVSVTGNNGIRTTSSAGQQLYLGNTGGDAVVGTLNNYSFSFISNGSERARITSGGYFKASNNGSYVGSTGAYHEMVSNDTGNTLVIRNSSTSSATDGTLFISNARNTTDNTYYIIGAYNTTAAAFKFRVADSGNVTNTNNSYGAISDVKTKKDIVDAASQWDDLKGLRVRKFRYKNDPTAPLQIGLVAQEAETVSPGLIDEHPDYEEVEVTDEEGNVKTERQLTGTSTKSVKYSILYMKAIKALQEAMTRIETLEAKVAALEGTQP